MLALIDGDIVVYRCAFAAESTVYQAPDGNIYETAAERNEYCKENDVDPNAFTIIKTVQPLSHALQNVNTLIEKSFRDNPMFDEGFIIYLSGKHNFRDDVATIKKYKGSRDSAPRPYHYKAVRDHLLKVWKAVALDHMEADDALALAQNGGTCICSIFS